MVSSCSFTPGVFFHNSYLKFSDVRDGLAYTLFVGERNSKKDYSTWVGVVHGAKYPITRIMATVQRPPNDVDGQFEDFSSSHIGGTLFVFGDGSVRWIRDGISLETFRSLGTRGDRDLISEREIF